MNCRGKRRRIQIVKEYNVKPIAYLRLLNGQTKRSDAEANLTDKYYIFECMLKSNSDITEIIICGNGAGAHFLELINQNSPSLFNPLKTSDTGKRGNGEDAEEFKTDKWNEVAQQLYNAIQWLIICWDIIPKGPILDIRDKVEKYRKSEPFISQIKAVNTIISKDPKKRTLTEMIDGFRKDNDIKNYDFNYLISKLDAEGIKPYF